MKQEKTLEFNTSELGFDEAVMAAKEAVDENTAYKTTTTSGSDTHTMIKSSGTKVSVMSMGTELRVHIVGSQNVLQAVEEALDQNGSRDQMYVQADELPGDTSVEEMRKFQEAADPTTTQVQVMMELHEDGSLNMDMMDGGKSEIMTEAGLFIQEQNGTLTVGEMYLDESFGMKYDTQHVEQLLNEIREAMLEEVR